MKLCESYISLKRCPKKLFGKSEKKIKGTMYNANFIKALAISWINTLGIMETTAQLEKKLHLFFITILGSTKVTNSYRFPPSKGSSDGWSRSFLLLPLSHFVSRALSTFLLKLGQISAQCFLLSLYTILNQSLISTIQKVRCTIGLWSKHSTGKQFKESTKWKKMKDVNVYEEWLCSRFITKKKRAIYLWTTDKASGVSQVPRSIQSCSLHFGIFLSNTGFDHSSFFQDSCHNKSVSLAQVLQKNQRNTSLISKRRQQMCGHQAIKNVWLSPNRLELDQRVDALN